MRILLLGGTVFLGRHVANEALQRGHELTLFTRGLHGTAPEGAKHVIGDRADPSPLEGHPFDAAIDTSGYEPEHVAASAALDVAHYVFVSSISAYERWPEEPVDEDSPVYTEGDGYGELKAACERAAQHAKPTAVVIDATEPLWRERERATLVTLAGTDVKHYELTRDPWVFPQQGPGSDDIVDRIVRAPGGQRAIVLLKPGSREHKLSLVLKRLAFTESYLDGPAASDETYKLVDVAFPKAPWEEED